MEVKKRKRKYAERKKGKEKRWHERKIERVLEKGMSSAAVCK